MSNRDSSNSDQSHNNNNRSSQLHNTIIDHSQDNPKRRNKSEYNPKIKANPTTAATSEYNNNKTNSSLLQNNEREPLIRRRHTSKSPDSSYKDLGMEASYNNMNSSNNGRPQYGSGNYNNYATPQSHQQQPSQPQQHQLQPTESLTFDDQSTIMSAQAQQMQQQQHNLHNITQTHPSLRLLREADVPYEIYNVRKRALTVLKPLTNTWIIICSGLAFTVAFAAARFLHLLPTLPVWVIFLPSLLSHAGVFYSHLLSAKNLSRFIAEANEGRQRPDSRDHLDRTEYLPLLQRSLKFGLKTGTLCSLLFLFELLLCLHLHEMDQAANENALHTGGAIDVRVSLNTCLFPIWILVLGGICDGIICKTQNFLMLTCWIMSFLSMTMLVLKLDYGFEEYSWTVILFPVGVILFISGGSLIYVIYGHQLGYFHLTENQYMSGIMYCVAIFMMFCLCVILSEVIPGLVPDMHTRIFVTILSPLVVTLIGLGGWGVSKDEYKRMLLLGGQQSVHPMRLRLEPAGWTAVESRGVALFPMFGEVSYEPLDSDTADSIEMCVCCSMCACYPVEDKQHIENQGQRYIQPQILSPSRSQGFNRNDDSINSVRSNFNNHTDPVYEHTGGVDAVASYT